LSLSSVLCLTIGSAISPRDPIQLSAHHSDETKQGPRRRLSSTGDTDSTTTVRDGLVQQPPRPPCFFF
jgi:hypothetical protein